MPRKRPRDDDDYDEDDAPAPRRSKRGRRQAKSGISAGWLIGGLALGLVVLVGIAVAVVASTRGGGAPAPRELQGEWRMVSLEAGGRTRTVGQLPNDGCVIAGDRMTTYGTNGEFESRIRVDATREPKELDIVNRGATYPAIYKVEGDTLTICINEIGAPRPREFSSRGLVGSGGLATYKRVPR